MRQAVGSGLRGAVPALAGRLWKGRVFALCARDGFVRLQCSLRHGPATAGVLLGTGYPLKLGTGCGERMRQAVGSGLRGAVPALAGRLREGLGFRASREGWVCSPSMLASARSRYRWGAFGDGLTKECSGDRLLGDSEAGWAGLFGGLRGAVPALAGRLREGLGFRASREGWVCSPSMLASARSRCRWVGFGDRLTNAFGDRLLGYSEVGWAGLFGGLRETVPFLG